MSIVVTNVGLQAIANADAGGFLINLDNFKLSYHDNITLSVEDEALAGVPLYEARVATVESVSSAVIRVTLSLPQHFPTTGSIILNEFGLYLESGELFAHGAFESPFEKTPDFGFDIYVYVTAARLGDVINITEGTTCAIASTPHVRTLLPPVDSQKNAVAVLDQYTTDDDRTTASLAIKYGPGGLDWGFVGYARQYRGNPDAVVSTSEFNLNIEENAGFWLNNDEVVIVQVITGKGKGESRRVRYTKPSKFTVLEKPFSELDTQSLITIWREARQALPSRYSNIPETYVLGIGVNSWARQQTEVSQGALKPYRFTTLGNGTDFVDIPAVTAFNLSNLDNNSNFIIFKNGLLLRSSEYSILYDINLKPYRIQFNSTITGSDSLDVVIFSRYSWESSAVYMYEGEYTANNEDKFALPIIPDSKDNVLVFLDGVLTTDFTFNSSYIELNTPFTGKVAVVPFANYIDEGITAYIKRTTTISAANQTEFPVIGANIAYKRDTLVTVNGKYIEKEKYDLVNGNTIVFSEGLLFNDIVNIVSFEALLSEPLTLSVSGKDTGPVWVDPAGFDGTPNKINVGVIQDLTSGASSQVISIPAYMTNGQEHQVLVFIGSCLQDSSQYTIQEAGSNGANLTLISTYQSGLPIDIYYFYESISTGMSLEGSSFVFNNYSSGTTVNLLLGPDQLSGGRTAIPESIMVFLDGTYQHRSTYTIYETGTPRLVFNEPVTGYKRLTIYMIGEKVQTGYRTEFAGVPWILSNANNYDTTFQFESIANKNHLAFIGAVHQTHDEYYLQDSTVNGKTTSFVKFNSTANIPIGKQLYIWAFKSGLPKTRLILRSEFEEYCNSLAAQIGSSNYSLPIASASTAGIMKVGSGLSVDAQGLVNSLALGNNQAWYAYHTIDGVLSGRAARTWYQNTTGRPIALSAGRAQSADGTIGYSSTILVSDTPAGGYPLSMSSQKGPSFSIIPPNNYYQVYIEENFVASDLRMVWFELR